MWGSQCTTHVATRASDTLVAVEGGSNHTFARRSFFSKASRRRSTGGTYGADRNKSSFLLISSSVTASAVPSIVPAPPPREHAVLCTAPVCRGRERGAVGRGRVFVMPKRQRASGALTFGDVGEDLIRADGAVCPGCGPSPTVRLASCTRRIAGTVDRRSDIVKRLPGVCHVPTEAEASVSVTVGVAV
jgi:hypothetical protein